MPHAYTLLLVTEPEDPSEILNLIDTARATIDTAPATPDQVARKCDDAESFVHLRFTPTGLLALALA